MFRPASQQEPKAITLKNGSQEADVLVAGIMLSLKSLMKENPIALYELVMKCRNPNHQMFGNTKDVCEELALVERNSVHDSIRNVVLSAVEGDGLSMKLGSPVAAAPSQPPRP